MGPTAAISPPDDDRPKCWICRDPLKARKLQRTATGLCQRCYSREYQRSVRTGDPMVRTPADAQDSGRADLLGCLKALPPPKPAQLAAPTARHRTIVDRHATPDVAEAVARFEAAAKAAQADASKLKARLIQLAPVAEAARAWYRGQYLTANVKRLIAAVEALNRGDACVTSREVEA